MSNSPYRFKFWHKVIKDLSSLEICINKIPPNSVIGLLYVYFDDHPFPAIVAFHRVDDFLSNDDVISDVFPRNKASLLLCNDFGKYDLEPIGYNLHDKFIGDKAKANRAELREILKVLDFGN